MAVQTHYEITHTCKHTRTIDLTDKKAGDRAGLAAWYAKKECFDCYRKSRGADGDDIAQRREQEAAEAAEFAERSELPTFEGTEKQVRWATDVRHKLIRAAYVTLVTEGDVSEADFDSTVIVPARIADKPSWWIDNREQEPADLPELLESVASDETASSTENPF